MSKSNTFENDLLKLIFNNDNIADVGDATGLRGSSTAGSLYLSLHTSDPGEGGTAATNECNYTDYARVAVGRTSGNFTVSGNSVTLAANQDFPNPGDATNLSQTATHFSVTVASSGTSKMLYKGTVTPNIVIANTGVTPRLTTGTTITED